MADNSRARPTDQALAVPVEPASGLAPAGFDPSRDESTLRSKARALADSVWDEHRKTAVMTFETISDDARNILIDCCFKGMCVGMIAGSSLLRDSDEHPQDENAQRLSGEAVPARAEGIAQTIPPTETHNGN